MFERLLSLFTLGALRPGSSPAYFCLAPGAVSLRGESSAR